MGSNGWQEVDFSQPVTIDANTTYIASYFAPNGHYSANSAYFYTTPPMGTNPVAGNYAFKFTVTDRNASSIDYRLAFDYIELVPQ